MTDNVGLCKLCPRVFCPGCIARIDYSEVAAAALNEAELARVGTAVGRVQGSDIWMQKCPKCLHGSDLKLPGPPPDAGQIAKKVYLLQELLNHDLSHCFRAPVDSTIYSGYGSIVPQEIRMDLSSMLIKILEKEQYRRKRGAAAFYRDTDLIRSNCRGYAKCDLMGRPKVGGNDEFVPGIVRCVFRWKK